MTTRDITTTMTIPINTLSVWMEKFGHSYLDILKIDIKGSEYEVLEDLLDYNYLPFTQLLVEYHDQFLSASDAREHCHARLLQRLKEAGMVESWSANGGQEVGYIKKGRRIIL